MSERKWLARIDLGDGDGVIVLRRRWEWEVETPGDGAGAALAVARLVTLDYKYSPADGRPGAVLAYMVADRVGGTVTLPPAPPEDPDAIH